MDRAPVYFVAKRSLSSSSSNQRRDDNENYDGHDDAIDRKLITVILRLSPPCLVVKLSPAVKLFLLPR